MAIDINPEKQIQIICSSIDEFNVIKSWLTDVKLVRHTPVRAQTPGDLASQGLRGNVIILSPNDSYDEFQIQNILMLKERNTVTVAQAISREGQFHSYTFLEYFPPSPEVVDDEGDDASETPDPTEYVPTN